MASDPRPTERGRDLLAALRRERFPNPADLVDEAHRSRQSADPPTDAPDVGAHPDDQDPARVGRRRAVLLAIDRNGPGRPRRARP